ncbi:hypothetical protein PP359_13135 [Sphingomonas sp. BLCC-B65]|nr:hypothetical protein [Sphingomonas sp. BLCC-B65]
MNTDTEDASPSYSGNKFTLEVAVGRANFSAAGESADVLKAFEQFQSLLRVPSATDVSGDGTEEEVRTATTSASAPPPAAETATGAGTDEVERVPLPVFLDSKQLPRGNAVIALAIAVWAKKFDGANEIDADTAKSYWRNSGRKIPANINRDLGSAASEGWLERLAAARGTYSVTSFGEKYFNGLPESV